MNETSDFAKSISEFVSKYLDPWTSALDIVDRNGQVIIVTPEGQKYRITKELEQDKPQKPHKTILLRLTGTVSRILRTDVPARIRVKVLKRDNYTCVWCGKSAKDGARLEVDHIIPCLSSIGKTMTNKELNHTNNLRTLCRRCNIGKSNKLDDELEIV